MINLQILILLLIMGKSIGWDKATRVGLRNLVDSNPEEVSIVLGDKIIEMPVDKAKDFLSQLEVYAGKCFVTTTKHL